MDHLLFVSHKANRSGARILLLDIINAVRNREQTIPVTILCMEDGELIPEFAKLGKTYVWKINETANATLFNRIKSPFHRLQQIIHGLVILSAVKKCTNVFFNTIANGHLHKKLHFKESSTICYVHELEAAIQMLTNEETRKSVFGKTGLFLCVSEAVKHNLAVNHHIQSHQLKVVSTPLQHNSRKKEQYSEYIDQFKNRHQIANKVIVGIMGGSEWRKGFDLFVPLVTLFNQLFPGHNACFVWKGCQKDHYQSFFHLYDIERSTIKDTILLLPHGNDNIEQMACFDIHLLLSREDPYPLVVLEAASLGIPTVCFANAGGAPEFVESDCGFVVTYEDLWNMANKVYELVNNTTLRNKMGECAHEKVVARHDKEKALKVITDIIIEKTKHQNGVIK